MRRYEDFECYDCGKKSSNFVSDDGRIQCYECSSFNTKLIEAFRPPSLSAGVCSKETAIVWRHPKTGEIRYPGRNDTPIPEAYRQQGYERFELNSLRKMDKFERETGTVNEKAHFTDGSSTTRLDGT